MSVLSTLAAQFAQHELTKFSAKRRGVARKAERARIDAHFARVRGGRTAKKKSAPPTQSQKAASRRDSIMKKVVPHKNLLKALTIKKK